MKRFITSLGIIVFSASAICAQQPALTFDPGEAALKAANLVGQNAPPRAIFPDAPAPVIFPDAPTPAIFPDAPPAKIVSDVPPPKIGQEPQPVEIEQDAARARQEALAKQREMLELFFEESRQSMAQNAGAAPNGGDAHPGRTLCVWGGGEYLLWTVSHAPIAVPLVTGNNNGSGAFIGAVNEPGTTSLLGSGSGTGTSFGWLSGARFTLGGRLDSNDILGVEVTGFFFQEGVVNFSRSSIGGDNPIVSIPFNATQPFPGNPAGPSSLNAGGAPNTVSAQLTSQLWGLEANQVLTFRADNQIRWSGLFGLRYIDLHESLNLKDTFLDTTSGNSLDVNDSFSTHNQFYGLQLGTRFEYTTGRWIFDGTVKVAIGPNVESTTIDGNTVVNGGAFGHATGVYPGGVFAQPSNIGHYEQTAFAVVPEAQFKVRYVVSKYVQTFVGYNFLYISETDRPGNQVNGNINPTQSALFGGGTVHGAPAPVNTFQSSGFWAQGFNLGLEFRY